MPMEGSLMLPCSIQTLSGSQSSIENGLELSKRQMLYDLVRLVHLVVLEDDELRRLKQRRPDRIVRTLTTP